MVEVPNKVINPPKIVEKDKGINNLEGEIFFCLLHCSTMGKKIATTAVLLIKALIGPTIIPIIKICWEGLFPPHFNNQSLTILINPVLATPALKINIAITVMVAELLNPEIPSSGDTKPKTINKIATIKAVKSTGNHSQIKATKANIKTDRVKKIFIS